jgi:hypothetical protein
MGWLRSILADRDISSPTVKFQSETFDSRAIAIECLRTDPVIRREVIDGKSQYGTPIDHVTISKKYIATVPLEVMRDLLNEIGEGKE